MATRFQLGTISTQAAPAGAVHAFAGASAPTGWLLCNGAAVSRTVYAALFAAIASAHGSGDGSTTFNLPDYRGRMIRGVDGGVARDPDRAGRTAAASGGNTGDNVGSVQAQSTARNGMTVTNNAVTSLGQSATHSHSTTATAVATGGSVTFGAGGTFFLPVTGNNAASNGNASGDHTHNITSNVTLNTGDNETRPINAYVNYIIKV